MENGRDSLVYLGTVDDVVLRFPWSNINIGKNFLIETILDHVIFGNPLLINDGYLINHPLARKDLLKGEKSLILHLVRRGFIKVLTRESSPVNIKTMPFNMAEEIESFEKAVSKKDWKNFQTSLGELGDSLRFNYNCFKWPPVDMGDGFRVILENVSNNISAKGYDTLGFNTKEKDLVISTINQIGERLSSNTQGARNHFEQQCKLSAEHLPKRHRKLFVNDMMGLANEVYHYNFGINLDYHLRVTGSNVVTETRFSKCFDDLLSIEEDEQQHFSKNFPLIQAPKIIKSINPKIVSEIVDPFTEIGREKEKFLKEMRLFSSGQLSIEDAKIASNNYLKSLAYHFSETDPLNYISKPLDIGLIVTSGLIGAAIPGSYEILAGSGVGLGFLSTYVCHPKVLRAVRGFKRKSLENKMSKINAKKISLDNGNLNRAILGVLKFNSKVTDPIAKRIRRF